MALHTQWTRANSRRWWRTGTGKPGVLQSMGLQGVRHDLATERNGNEMKLCAGISRPSLPVNFPGIVPRPLLFSISKSVTDSKWKVKVKLLSHVRLFATPWTVAYQASPSMGFSRQENQSRLPSRTYTHVGKPLTLEKPICTLDGNIHFTYFRADVRKCFPLSGRVLSDFLQRDGE